MSKLKIFSVKLCNLKENNRANIVMEVVGTGTKYYYPDMALKLRQTAREIGYRTTKEYAESFLNTVKFDDINVMEIIQPIFYYNTKEIVLDFLILDRVIKKHNIREIIISRNVMFDFVYIVFRYGKVDKNINVKIKSKFIFLLKYGLWKLEQNVLVFAHFMKVFLGLFLVKKSYKAIPDNIDTIFCSFGRVSLFKPLQKSIVDVSKECQTAILSGFSDKRYSLPSEEKRIARSKNISLLLRESHIKAGDFFYVLNLKFHRKIDNIPADNKMARSLLEVIQYIYKRYIPLTKLQILIIERLLRKHQPTVCVVGEDAGYINRSVVAVSKKKRISSFTVQHGVIQDIYMYLPYSDYFIASSTEEAKKLNKLSHFFKSRVIVDNSHSKTNYKLNINDVRRNKVLLVSTTFSKWEFLYVYKGIEELLKWVDSKKLVVKLHPLEKSNHYRRLDEQVHIVQKGDIVPLLKQSKLAIFFDISTVMTEAINEGCLISLLENPLITDLNIEAIPKIKGKEDIDSLLSMNYSKQVKLLKKQHLVVSQLFGSLRGSKWDIIRKVINDKGLDRTENKTIK
ncbi:MAG: hypothetical protein ACUZ8E_01200 [Candidatus Anammoxibacter sp.]